MFAIGLMVGLFVGVWVGGYVLFRSLGFSNEEFWTKTTKELRKKVKR